MIHRIVLLITGMLVPALVHAQYLMRPIDARNCFALYITHLHMPIESSRLLEPGAMEVRMTGEYSSTNIDPVAFENQGRTGRIDVETALATLGLRASMGNGYEVNLLLPYIAHHGGFMDAYIESFHDFFPGGLPNGGREKVRHNDCHVESSGTDGSVVMDSPKRGFADPSLYAKKAFTRGVAGFALLVGMKPRVGERSFINSGTMDLGGSVTADVTLNRFYAHAFGGAQVWFGDDRVSAAFSRDEIWQCGAGAGMGLLLVHERLYLHAQISGWTSPYNTGISKIDSPSIMLTTAVRMKPTAGSELVLSFTEDPFTYATTDFTMGLAFAMML